MIQTNRLLGSFIVNSGARNTNRVLFYSGRDLLLNPDNSEYIPLLKKYQSNLYITTYLEKKSNIPINQVPDHAIYANEVNQITELHFIDYDELSMSFQQLIPFITTPDSNYGCFNDILFKDDSYSIHEYSLHNLDSFIKLFKIHEELKTSTTKTEIKKCLSGLKRYQLHNMITDVSRYLITDVNLLLYDFTNIEIHFLDSNIKWYLFNTPYNSCSFVIKTFNKKEEELEFEYSQ